MFAQNQQKRLQKAPLTMRQKKLLAAREDERLQQKKRAERMRRAEE